MFGWNGKYFCADFTLLCSCQTSGTWNHQVGFPPVLPHEAILRNAHEACYNRLLTRQHIWGEQHSKYQTSLWSNELFVSCKSLNDIAFCSAGKPWHPHVSCYIINGEIVLVRLLICCPGRSTEKKGPQIHTPCTSWIRKAKSTSR